MHSVLQDVRYGGRMMVRNPGFTLAAILTLALGIGANSAIFSLVNVLSLKPLSYRDASRVAFLLGTDTESGATRFSLGLADYLDVRRQAESFAQVAAYTYLSANITGGDIHDRVQAYRVTGNTFELLGVSAGLGRTFGPAEARPGHERVAVISDGLWRRRFGADVTIIGRDISLNGVTHQVIGVMPARFEYPVFNFKGDLWIPWTVDVPATDADRSAGGSATVVARLRTGVSQAEADAELRTIMQRLAVEHPASNGTLGARVVEMGRLDDEQAGPAMAIVIVTVSIVLLLACANVANLLLARGVSRARELAVRAAVGASRMRIARQLLVEALMLAIAGAGAGVLLAKLGLDAIRRMLPDALLTTMPNIGELGIDGPTLMFTLGLAVTTSLVFGLVPALRAARPGLQHGLKEGVAGGGIATRRLRTALVVAEVALATVLLVSAGLLSRSYAGLRSASPGFSADRVLTMAMTLPEDRYPTAERRRLFFEEAADRIGQTPGVRSAAFVNVLPFSTYDRGSRFIIDGAPQPAAGKEPGASMRVASPGYFTTMDIPLLAGRPLEATDRNDTAPVAVVNRAFVRVYFGGQHAVGRRLRLAGARQDHPWITIVGVVGDVHHRQLTQVPVPELYLPLAQGAPPMMMLAVRAGGKPEELVNAVRGRILEVDPQQPVFHVKPMAQLVGDAMVTQTTSAGLMAVFSAVALVLAIVGVYGVVSFGVTQQMPEFGLRLALGATPASLVRRVLRGGALMVGAGIILGSAGAVAASGALGSLLYGVKPIDPLTYALAITALALLALAATLIPAWRASSAEPISALRGR